MNQIPKSKKIDIGKLVRIFESTTNSYKYLFFQALLRKLHSDKFINNYIPLRSIAEEMLVIAWYPHRFYRLSFGKQDQVAVILDQLNLDPDFSVSEKTLRTTIKKTPSVLDSLLRYVPFRLLTVFFDGELRGKSDRDKNFLIRELATKGFDSKKPLYRLLDTEELEVHHEWAEYLLLNYSIVESWVLWKWQNYLQNKNPNVPAISKKLFQPPARVSLLKETAYWKSAFKQKTFYCIYTGQELDVSSISLDHFLPWSFVGHNQLWNLLPVSKSTNSSKGNRIPSLDRYLDELIEMQLNGLTESRKELTEKVWRGRTESFISDLRISDYDGLFNKNILKERYEVTMRSLVQLAKNTGFSCDWRFSSL